jgi:hypothetical protein
VTSNNVSWRDCALAGDQMAGAGSAEAAVNAVIDLRNWRRFMKCLPRLAFVLKRLPQTPCHGAGRQCRSIKCLIQWVCSDPSRAERGPPWHAVQDPAHLLGSQPRQRQLDGGNPAGTGETRFMAEI